MSTLRIEPVTPDNVELLIRYCGQHGAEHDSSYLPGPGFEVTPQQPSYLLLSEGEVVGAASLMLVPRYTRMGVGRFAILHSTRPEAEAYRALHTAVRRHTGEVRKLFLFLPDHRAQTAAILEGLGFAVERYSYVLRRAPAEAIAVTWPVGVVLEALAPGDTAGAGQFAACLNDSFARLAGHGDLSGDDLRAWFQEEDYLEGGILLLKQDGRPIGTMMVMQESEDSEAVDVSALGIVTARQGQGLGRRLLRYAIDFAARRGFHSVMLSVNAENESALRLYLAEGFKPVETMVCYACRLDGEGTAGASP